MALTKITSDGITDGTIVSADINASAAIDGSKITPTFSTDATINGVTVGKGANSVSGNIALGTSALDAVQSGGASNVAIGDTALTDLTTGSQNVAVGLESGFDITTGSNNTAVGFRALKLNQTNANNVAVGALHYKQIQQIITQQWVILLY